MKFRHKLTILMLAISIPLILVPFILSERIAQELRVQAEENIKNIVEAKTEFYEHIFADLRKELEVMVKLIEENWGKGSFYNLSYIYIA
ncbi:MAG: hypothetical protein QXE46_00720 [Candidatus Thermoplasmatota archaeon]